MYFNYVLEFLLLMLHIVKMKTSQSACKISQIKTESCENVVVSFSNNHGCLFKTP